MTGRSRVTIATFAGGAVALAAATVWLASRSDGSLSRWSAITGIITAVFTVLAFVASIAPLAFRHEHKSEQDENNPAKPSEDVVTQQINNYGAGSVNAVAKGIQIVGHRHKLPKNDR